MRYILVSNRRNVILVVKGSSVRSYKYKVKRWTWLIFDLHGLDIRFEE